MNPWTIAVGYLTILALGTLILYWAHRNGPGPRL